MKSNIPWSIYQKCHVSSFAGKEMPEVEVAEVRREMKKRERYLLDGQVIGVLKLIAKDFGYGPMAYLYAYAMYLPMISPSWV